MTKDQAINAILGELEKIRSFKYLPDAAKRKVAEYVYDKLASGAHAQEAVMPAPVAPAVNDAEWPSIPALFCSYGNVNFCHDDDPRIALMALQAANVDGFQIEAMGAGSQFGKGPDWSLQAEALAKILTAWCLTFKGTGKWLVITIWNWNAKYKTASVAGLQTVQQKVIEAIIATGNRHVVLQPVSEPNSSKQGGRKLDSARALTRHARSLWAGPMMLNDSATLNAGIAFEIEDWHVSSTKQLGGTTARKPNTTNTDHSTVLAEIMTDGTREGQVVNTAKMAPHAQAARRSGRWYLLYHFWASNLDLKAIQALGVAYHGSTSSAATVGSATLVSVAKRGDSQISFEASGIGQWPVKLDQKKNRYLGGSVRINGTIVDHFWQDSNTAFVSNAWGNDEHRIAVRAGEVVSVDLVSIDGKQKTNSVPFAWPFKGTV